MLTGNDKLTDPPVEQFEPARSPKAKSPWFEHLFLRFGAGAHLLEPLTRAKYWNTFCWIIIALGIAGWIVLFWFVPPFTP